MLFRSGMEFWLSLELFRESQAPCRAVCRPCGFFRMMHGGVSAPSRWASGASLRASGASGALLQLPQLCAQHWQVSPVCSGAFQARGGGEGTA